MYAPPRRQLLSALAAMFVASTLLTVTVMPEPARAATCTAGAQIAPYQFA